MHITLVELILFPALLLAGLWAVMSKSLVKAAIGLALTSAILTVLIFFLGSPVAGAFELSVCAGLITVIFISTISLTKPMCKEEEESMTKDRIKRYWPLPVILVALGAALIAWHPNVAFFPLGATIQPGTEASGFAALSGVIWQNRLLDIAGQIFIIIAGAFGVVVLLKEKSHE